MNLHHRRALQSRFALGILLGLLVVALVAALTASPETEEVEAARPASAPAPSVGSSTTTTTIDIEAAAEYAAAIEAARATTTTTPPPPPPPPLPAPVVTEPPTTAPPVTEPAPAVRSGSVWDELAYCEAGGNWSYPPVGSYGYSGGLMFLPSTWNAYGGQEFAPMAYQASREQQIVVAERILASHGGTYRAWPGCRAKLGLP